MYPLPPVLPVLNDNFFLPDAIDFNIANNASQPLYTFADLDSDGTKTISHLEFGRAAHRVAHLLRPNRSGVDGEVVAIILIADTVMYQAIVAGLIVAGCVPFPISPRISPEAVIELLTKTSCRRLLTTHAYLESLINTIKSHTINTFRSNVKIEEMPSFSSVYPYLAHETADRPFKSYPPPIKRPFKYDLCLYLHSSGSTGNPRPIPITQISWTQCALPTDLKEYKPRLTLGVMIMPSFHSFGMGVQLFQPVFGVLSVSVYPPNSAHAKPGMPTVASPENVIEHMKRTNSNALIAPPTYLQIWSSIPDVLVYLATLESVGFGGGPLAPKTGTVLLEAGIRLYAIYGATEFGMATRFIPVVTKYDWEYMQFHDHQLLRWVAQGDGTFELQFLSWEKHQTMINNLPDADGYATSDLWVPHPTDKSLWKIVGRIDDVITHSSGEKTVPGPIEAIITSDPLVRDAVVFGRQRDQTGILIELRTGIDVDDQVQVTSSRSKIWSTVQQANNTAPAYSRIFREMILFASKEKPLPRADKGTVLRKAALILYETEIDALYEDVDRLLGEPSSPPSWSVADIDSWLIEQAIDVISGPLDPAVDLFEQGFDSLCATILRKRIVEALRSSKDLKHQAAAKNLSLNLVYSFPVIEDLAVFLSSIQEISSEVAGNSVASSGVAAVETMIKKYTFGFQTSEPDSTSSTQPIVTSPAFVLLTGSTGNLGSQILAILLAEPRVERVYAYNRPSKAGNKALLERHYDRFEELGLDITLLRNEKIVLITGDSTKPNLGLDQETYSLLCKTVNVVIHNAWRLDFNLSLASYEPNILGMRHFIDLVKSGPDPANTQFLFISSIASVQNWDNSKGPVPEDVIKDAAVALGSGYGEAKHVAERILLQSGLQGLSLRIGQISGGHPKGVWPITEWLPILVKSSVSLGAIPDASGLAPWLRADTIATIIVDVALNTHSKPLPTALSLVHPRPVKQSEIIKNIKKAIHEVLGRNLKLVPFVKLFEFFRNYAEADTSGNSEEKVAGGLPSLSTQKAQQLSSYMQPDRLQQIGYNDAKLWVSYWHAAGFLD
ncbi:putative NRPS-like protein biosynthetic cluster [Tephrocybe sp. NHM501043]|nr:putative NRPS-like protein biosynthetic cluster [Tephrocybe sp. NHM501043]